MNLALGHSNTMKNGFSFLLDPARQGTRSNQFLDLGKISRVLRIMPMVFHATVAVRMATVAMRMTSVAVRMTPVRRNILIRGVWGAFNKTSNFTPSTLERLER